VEFAEVAEVSCPNCCSNFGVRLDGERANELLATRLDLDLRCLFVVTL